MQRSISGPLSYTHATLYGPGPILNACFLCLFYSFSLVSWQNGHCVRNVDCSASVTAWLKSLAGYDGLSYLRLHRGARQTVNPYCVCHMHFCIWLSYLIFCNKEWRGGGGGGRRFLLWFWINETFRGATERKKARERSCGAATHLAAFFLSSVRLSSPTHLRKEGAEDVELCLLTSPCEQFGEWVGARAKREGARLWQRSGQWRQNKWAFLSSRIEDVQGVNIWIFGLRVFFVKFILKQMFENIYLWKVFGWQDQGKSKPAENDILLSKLMAMITLEINTGSAFFGEVEWIIFLYWVFLA